MDITLWHLVEVAAWIIMLLLGVGGFFVKREMERLQQADTALTQAITTLTDALANMRADLPMQYVLKVDMLHIQQAQADETRAMRAEITGLRHDLTNSISGLRADITGMIVAFRQELASKR